MFNTLDNWGLDKWGADGSQRGATIREARGKTALRAPNWAELTKICIPKVIFNSHSSERCSDSAVTLGASGWVWSGGCPCCLQIKFLPLLFFNQKKVRFVRTIFLKLEDWTVCIWSLYFDLHWTLSFGFQYFNTFVQFKGKVYLNLK